ncbi:MAG: hypothetical protein GKR97_18745 [Rhizobiaceae bacterium]|nr:hypothetical protein [Rhizobiaceae bacterium]
MSANADPRLDKFIRDFDRLGEKWLSFHDPKSPLYPYRHHHFDEGLTEADQRRLNDLQVSGDCGWNIYDLMVTGFFGLNPHLEPIMVDRDRYPKVRSAIRGGYPAILERCIYFRRKRKLDQWIDVTLYPPFDGAHGDTLEEVKGGGPDRFLAWHEWQYLAHVLGMLAFCQSYPPSIRDVWANAGQPGGLTYSTPEAIYLTGRASKHGMLSNQEFAAAIAEFRRQGVNLIDIHRLLDEARSHRLHQMRAVRGNWQFVCKTWYQHDIVP